MTKPRPCCPFCHVSMLGTTKVVRYAGAHVTLERFAADEVYVEAIKERDYELLCSTCSRYVHIDYVGMSNERMREELAMRTITWVLRSRMVIPDTWLRVAFEGPMVCSGF